MKAAAHTEAVDTTATESTVKGEIPETVIILTTAVQAILTEEVIHLTGTMATAGIKTAHAKTMIQTTTEIIMKEAAKNTERPTTAMDVIRAATTTITPTATEAPIVMKATAAAKDGETIFRGS